MQRILAATDFSTRSQRSVRRAGLLARQTGAELTILHAVEDDQPTRLVELERKEAGKILDEQLNSVAELRGINCRLVVTAGDAFDAILRTAESTSADLVVMGSHRKKLLRDIFVGTTIERVVRTGLCPVLMVNNEAAHPYSRVLAAVDMSDNSAHALQSAKALSFLDQAHRDCRACVRSIGKIGKLFMADVPKERIADYVDQEREGQRGTGLVPAIALGLSVARGLSGSKKARRSKDNPGCGQGDQRGSCCYRNARPFGYRQGSFGQRGRRSPACA